MSGRDELAARLLATFVAELADQVRLLDDELLALESEPSAAEPLRAVFRAVHSLKGAAAAAGVHDIERVCHELESLLASVRSGKARLEPDHFGVLFAATDALRDAGARLGRGDDLSGSGLAALYRRLKSDIATPQTPTFRAPVAVSERPTTQPPPAITARSSPTGETQGRGVDSGAAETRVQAARLDALMAATSDLVATSARVQELPAGAREVELAALGAADAWRQAQPAVRLGLERAAAPTAARDSVLEVERAMRRLAAVTRQLAQTRAGDIRAVARTTRQVSDQVHRLRLRPFADTCEGLPRAVRDLAVSAGKEVKLRVEGKDVEADRAVLDGLGEVVLQLVRNAVDHGIEPPAERTARGKPPHGTVTVAAEVRGERLLVRVSDDGAGIDIASIRAALARQKLPVPDGDDDVLRALLTANVSTRRSVTPVSGRGVGLDIAGAAMARLRGRIEGSSVRGAGTTFVLECPPALATLHALLARVGEQTFALPITAVSRVMRVRQNDVLRLEGRDAIADGDSVVPVASLASLLGPPFSEAPFTTLAHVALVRAGALTLALRVDALVGEQELVARPLEPMAEPPPHISGAALLASGGIALLLNPFTLVDAGYAATPVARGPATEPQPASLRRVLVVDDSITTRTLEQTILQSAGYDVSTAVDGADAWRMLQEHGADLVVADVEMPQLDGFGLCRLIRASKRFRDLPVILVSALESAEHRQRGLEYGADAYLGKSSFDQERLLELVQQLIGQRSS